MFLLLAGGIVAYGRAQQRSNMVLDLGFDFCGDRACFLGVIPGQTTWDETLQRL
jgi:hypothetical protein